MATGSTADFALTRNEVIASALRKIKGWPGAWVALIGAAAAGTGLAFALVSKQEDA